MLEIASRDLVSKSACRKKKGKNLGIKMTEIHLKGFKTVRTSDRKLKVPSENQEEMLEQKMLRLRTAGLLKIGYGDVFHHLSL